MVQVLDNYADQKRLGNEVLRYFDSFECLDVATGYFNLRGWRLFVDSTSVVVVN